MLGANELPLRQGFRLRRKRLYGAPAPPRSAGPEGKAKMLPPLLLVQLEDSQERLRGQLHRAQTPHLLPARPAKSPTSRGPLSDFTCSGQMNCPCAKVFASGENACTALPRRPAPRGPRARRRCSRPSYSSSLRTARNASVGSCTLPRLRIFFLPSFCFSSSFFFRVMSPP